MAVNKNINWARYRPGVRLDRTMVSRSHARLVSDPPPREPLLSADLDSKNGTFRAHQRVTSPIRLADGDAIGIGSLLLTFHSHIAWMSTDTLAPGVR